MARQRGVQADESFQELRFPLGGIDLSMGFDRQPNKPLPNGEYCRTTPIALNVRAVEPTSQRARGGSRPGLQKYVSGQIDSPRSSWVQELNVVVATSGNIPGSGATVPAIFYYDLTGNVTLGNGNTAAWSYQNGVLSYQTIVGVGGASGGPTVCVVDGRQNFSIPTHYTYRIVQNGQVLASGLIAPAELGVPLPIAATACTDQTNYYFSGQSVKIFTPPWGGPGITYTFGLTAVDVLGNPVWSQEWENWDGQGIPPAPGTYIPQPAGGTTVDCIPIAAVSGKVYACFPTTSTAYVHSFSASTGDMDSSPFPLAVIGPISGYQVMAFQGLRPQQVGGGLMTFGSGKLAVMLWQPGPGGIIAPNASYGVAFVNISTGAVTSVTGLQPVVPSLPIAIDSDGTDFYVSVSTKTLVGTQVVQKISGTTGAVLWTSAPFTGTGPVSYFGAVPEVLSSGSGSSVAFDPSTGSTLGAGTGANILAFSNAGTYTSGGTPVNAQGASQASNQAVLVGVAGGTVKVAFGGAWQSVTNGSQVLDNTVAVVRSAACNGRLYFLDTEKWWYYDPPTNTVHAWTASQGTLPVDSNNALPRLICNWRGRLLLSGVPGSPYDAFMSAQSDPTNWQYFPDPITPTQAVALSTGPMGLCEDIITSLVPFSDDILIFGGDHTIYQLVGDPMQAARLDKVSGIIGMAWGSPWCVDPYQNVYFVSNRCGIYVMSPGNVPQRISQQIEQLLSNIPLSTVVIRMFWDDQLQGLHVFVTPFGGAATCTHFFWDYRIGSWFTEQFANNNLNPLCGVSFYASNPSDRVVIIGSWDGYARAFQLGAPTDDGTAINSEVLIGPVLTKDFDDIMGKDIQGLLGANSGPVTYNIYTGATAEIALNNAPVSTGTWQAGRNLTSYIRQAGHAIYVGLSASSPWQMESIRLRVAGLGKVRRRGV